MQVVETKPYMMMKVDGKATEMVVGLPSWAMFRLGKQVRLTELFCEDELGQVFRAGSVGMLDAVQYRPSGPTAMVDFGTWEGCVEVPFSLLEPIALEYQDAWV